MSPLRLLGLLSGTFMLVLISVQWFTHRIRRGEALLAACFAGSLVAAAAHPPLVDGLTSVLAVETRPQAIGIVADIGLLALCLHVLRSVADVRGAMGDLVRGLARHEFERSHPRQGAGGIEVVIPAFDEERSLQDLLPKIPSSACDLPVSALVIVDGGRDASASVARGCAVPVTSHVINRGQGDALRTGFELALRRGADIVVTMDADGQHRPEDIPPLVSPIVSGEADFVLGSRVIGQAPGQGAARKVGGHVFSALLSLVVGQRITDCANGFRAIRVSALERLELRERQFSAPELLCEAFAKGLRVLEVPVTVLPRLEGESRKPRSWRYPVGFFLAIVRAWLRR